MSRKSILDGRAAACAAAVLCTLLWGTAFPFIKLGYASFGIADDDIGSKLLFAGFRFTLAGAMVWAASAAVCRKIPTLKFRGFGKAALLGTVQTAVQYIFTYIGIGFTNGASTSVITACSSFFTVLAAPLFFKSDRLTFIKTAGCVVGFAGVALMNGLDFQGEAMLFGDIMILLSTVSAAAGNIISKKAASDEDPVILTAYQLLIGGVILTVCGLALGGRLSFEKAGSAFILLWLAVVSAAAFAIWTALLKRHPASKISVFNLLVPVFGTLLSGIVLGDDVFNPRTAISVLLICVGISAVNLTGFNTEGRSRNGRA